MEKEKNTSKNISSQKYNIHNYQPKTECEKKQ